MKKLILLSLLVGATTFAFGQNLQKGNFMSLHVMTVSLKPNMTMEQFKTYFISDVIPAYEKQFKVKGYLVKGVRGEAKDSFGILWLWKTEQDRNEFFAPDGKLNASGKAAIEQVTATDKEMDKIGTRTTKFTDWVVQ